MNDEYDETRDEEIEAQFRASVKTAIEALDNAITLFRAASAASLYGDHKMAVLNYEAALKLIDAFLRAERNRRKQQTGE